MIKQENPNIIQQTKSNWIKSVRISKYQKYKQNVEYLAKKYYYSFIIHPRLCLVRIAISQTDSDQRTPLCLMEGGWEVLKANIIT